jgi:hypothetical protein
MQLLQHDGGGDERARIGDSVGFSSGLLGGNSSSAIVVTIGEVQESVIFLIDLSQRYLRQPAHSHL